MLGIKDQVRDWQSVWWLVAVVLGLAGVEVVLAGFPRQWQFYLSLGLFGVGAVIGYFLVDLEQILFVFLIDPEAESSQLANKLWGERRYKDALRTALYYKDAPDRTRLPFTNLLFLLVWPVVCVYLVSSSGSSLAVGAGLAVYWRVWQRFYSLQTAHRTGFARRVGWLLERDWMAGELRTVLWVSLGILLLLIGMGL